jgi:hypothetical protein
MNKESDVSLCGFCGSVLVDFGCNLAREVPGDASSMEIDLSLSEKYGKEVYDIVDQMGAANTPGFELTDAELFDYCMILLGKQKEIELSTPMPEFAKYDEKKLSRYKLCGDLINLLMEDVSDEYMASCADRQIAGGLARYTNADDNMRDVFEKLSLVAYPGFGLTEGEIFLLAVGLLAK